MEANQVTDGHEDCHADGYSVTAKDPEVLYARLDVPLTEARRPYGLAIRDRHKAEFVPDYNGSGRARLAYGGQALASWRREHGSEWPLVSGTVMDGARATRVDLFRDTTKITPEAIQSARAEGRFDSRFQEAPTITYRDERPGQAPRGLTVQFGKSGNDVELAVYDKSAEQAYRGKPLGVEGLTRLELRTRREASQQAAKIIVALPETTDKDTGEVYSPLVAAFSHFLRDRLRFRLLKEPKKGKGATGIPDSPEWAAFAAVATPNVIIPDLRDVRPATDIKGYLQNAARSAMPAMAILAGVLEPEELHRVARSARSRVRRPFQDLLREDREVVRQIVNGIFTFLTEPPHDPA